MFPALAIVPRRCLPVLAMAASCCLAAQANVGPADNLANLSIEELSNLQITSVSRKAERLGDAAASVFVIRADDIRRAGARSLPEALRLAPNLQVARVDARTYAITARGFNNALANKLLVLIDGRIVYTPLFSGVFWEAQDLVMADIERIEVISGPGATLWGANAVNGVINILTRSAADTSGGLLQAGAEHDGRDASLRWGGKLGERAAWRAYGKVVEVDDSERDTGAPAQSGMRRHQAGFRLDTELGGAGAVLQGDAYRASLHNPGTRDTDLAGANLLGRLSQPLGEDGELRVQAYLDYTARDQANSINEHLSTVDLDLQHSLRLAPSAYLVWGGGHRIARDRVANPLTLAFLPANRDLVWTNLFVQGEWTPWTPLRLVGGLRAERNSYSGIGHLPYASVAFQAAPEQTWWASLARALRAPSRIDRDFYAPANGLPRYLLAGGPDFVSEVARVAQLGYRGQLARRLSVAATAFYSHYDLLRTIEYDARGAAVFRNNGAGSARGLELSASWELAANWRLTGGATAQRLQVGSKPGSKDLSTGGLVGGDPRSWSMLRSSYDWSETVDLDATLRHVGALPAPAVASYTVLDARIGWRVRPDLALSLQALNLGAPAHPEFGAASTPTRPGRSLFGPTLYGQLIWRF